MELALTLMKSVRRYSYLALLLAGLGAATLSCSDPVQRNIGILKRGSPDERGSAAFELGRLKDARAVEPLITCLREMNESAARTRGNLATAEDAATHNATQHARAKVAGALGRLGDARAVESLIACLMDPEDQAGGVSGGAARALAELGEPALEPLLACLKDDKQSHRYVAYALGDLKNKRAIGPLRAAWPNWEANQSIGVALRALGWHPESVADYVYEAIGAKNAQSLNRYWLTSKLVLMSDVKTGERRGIENAIYTFMSLGKEELVPELVDILESQGNVPMAETYLNCGHKALGEAARSWAARRGYEISGGAGAHKAAWGRW